MDGFSAFYSDLFSSIAAFVSTELDDFFLLLIMFAKCTTKSQKFWTSVGKCVALALVSVCSAVCASYLLKIPGKYIGLLGLVPIFFGVKAFIKIRKGGEPEKKEFGERKIDALSAMFFAILVSLGSSGDNFAVLIPYFTVISGWGYLICAAVFFVLQIAMLILASRVLEIPAVNEKLKKYGYIVIPVLLIALGIYILWKNGTISWFISFLGGA